MKFVLVVIALVASAKANPVGVDPCTWGPDYWCSDETKADQCGATRYCTENVWPQKTAEDPLCGVCELIISTLKNEINPTTVVDDLKSLCSELPSAISSECTSLVDNYGPMIIDLINSTTPEAICTEVGVCSASAKDQALPAIVSSPDSVVCDLCTAAIKIVEEQLSDNATEQEVINAIESVCNLSIIPQELQSQCLSLVQEYGPQLYEALINQDPNQVCSLLTLCSSSSEVQKPRAPLANTTMCIICEFAIREIQQTIGNNATEQEIINAIEGVCDILPSTVKTECTSLVDTYGKQLFDMLMHKDPEQVCSLLELCSDVSQYLLKGDIFDHGNV